MLNKFDNLKYLKKSYRNITGKNNLGKIVFYHRGGGYKRKYRIIDFSQKFINVLGLVKLIIFNPSLKNNIALICYLNGILSFNILIKNLKVNSFIKNFSKNLFNGSMYYLYQLPIGSYVSLLNLLPNKQLQLIRAPGTKGHILSRTNNLYSIKLPSKKIRFFSSYCKAIYGIVDLNLSKFLINLKAGKNRNLNFRPTVRGVAMNPIDHPRGGGQGKTSGGRKMSVSPWSKYTKGLKPKKKKNKIKLYLFFIKKFMIRSKWKGPFISRRIFKNFNRFNKPKRTRKLSYLSKLIDLKYLEKNLKYFVYNKSSVISLFFLNKRVAVYTGNKFHSFIVKKNMINHKFGEFILTKHLGKKIHILKKKKKK